MTIVFLKLLPKNTQIRYFGQKYPNKAFLIPSLGILFLYKILQLHLFEVAVFKYHISFLKF